MSQSKKTKPIRVPVAKDGTRFTAQEVCDDGTYRIGPKGREEFVHGFRNALTRLRQMEASADYGHRCCWNRISPVRQRGIVTGVRWETL